MVDPSDALAIARALAGRALLDRVARALEREGVEVAPLKGVLLHLVRPERPRPMLDVDVAVRPRARLAALAALHHAGFVERARGDGTATLAHPDFPLDLDLHWRLFQRGLFRMDVDGVLDRAEPRQIDGNALRFPIGLDVYAHLVGHFVRGRHDATDRRHLSDFGLVASIWSLNAAACAAHLEAMGVDRAARYVLPLAVHVVGDAFAETVLRALGRSVPGTRVASVAGSVLARHPGNAPLGALGCHLLNTSLPRAVLSLGIHLVRGAYVRARPVATDARALG